MLAALAGKGRLRLALLISLGMHVVVLSWWMHSLAPASLPMARLVQAQLLVPIRPPAQSVSEIKKDATALPRLITAERSVQPASTSAIQEVRVTREKEPSATIETVTPSAAASATTTVIPDGTAVAISADGLREYRLALGKTAGRFKAEYERNYSALERERRRGWEGRVEMSLRNVAHGGLPRLALVRSSGHPMLDEQALELLGRAVQVTPLPGALHGQSFSMPLVLDFRLEND